MGMSPAKKHRIREEAKKQSATTGENETPSGNAYELMQMQLAQHQRELHNIQSVEQKIQRKLEILPDYTPYIEGVLDADSGVQDDVLMNLLVWMVDVGDAPSAIQLASYAIKHGLSTPERFKRDTATLITEEIAEQALKLNGPGDPDILHQVEALVADSDMPDEVRAKLHKALGIAYGETDKPLAVEQLKRAMALHDKCGVKKIIEKLEREIKNEAPA